MHAFNANLVSLFKAKLLYIECSRSGASASEWENDSKVKIHKITFLKNWFVFIWSWAFTPKVPALTILPHSTAFHKYLISRALEWLLFKSPDNLDVIWGHHNSGPLIESFTIIRIAEYDPIHTSQSLCLQVPLLPLQEVPTPAGLHMTYVLVGLHCSSFMTLEIHSLVGLVKWSVTS